MQRLLSLRLVSKQLSNASSSSSATALSASSFLSHQYKTFSTLSHTTHTPHPINSWISHNTLTKRIQGFLSNPATVNHFSSNTHFKIPSGFLFLRAQFPKRSFWVDNSEFGIPRRTWKSWFRRFSGNDIVFGLIGANVAVFMLWQIADRDFMKKNFTISLENFKSGRVHTMITSAFSQMDTMHIVSNMIGLYFFGSNIARVFGPEYLLKLYLAGAIGGSVLFLLHHAYMAQTSKGRGFPDPSKIPGLGASGAVNAIMLLDIFLHPRSTLYLEFIIPVPAMLLGFFLIGKDMLRMIQGDSTISGSAHLGGALVAAIAWARLRKRIF